MEPRTKTATIAAVTMTVAIATGSLVALAASGDQEGPPARTVIDDGRQPVQTPAPAEMSPIEAVPQDVGAMFRVFRRPRTAGDTMPATAAGRIRQSPLDRENPKLARYLGQAPSGLNYYAVPAGMGEICVRDESGGGGCVETERLRNAIDVGVDICAPGLPSDKVRVYGIVPDGVNGPLEFQLQDGRVREVPIENNFYVAMFDKQEASQLPVAVRARDGSRAAEVPLASMPGGLPGC